jgi:hypothetical protein
MYLLGILLQTQRHEFLECLGKVSFKLRRVIFGYEEKNAHGMQFSVWGCSFRQLNCCDTQRPHIGLVIIARLLDHLCI